MFREGISLRDATTLLASKKSWNPRYCGKSQINWNVIGNENHLPSFSTIEKGRRSPAAHEC